MRGDAVGALGAFASTSLDEVLGAAERATPGAAAIELFHAAATGVPAYRAFLGEHGVDVASVRAPADLARVPRLTKANYVARWPLAERCWGGRLEACDRVAVSSGSTGEPTFWPRSIVDELPVARRFEQVLVDAFHADRRPTLAVVAFPMGTWVGGVFTTSCLRHVALRGHPVTTVAPGNVKEEILRVAFALGPLFEQTVLLGYPPFLKDVVDTARSRGLSFAPLRAKLVLAGEVVSEAWRTLMAERLGGADVLTDFASLYGTADGGVLGNETPLSIAIRRFLADRPDDARAVFGESRLPTLVQYDPTSRFFEAEGGTLSFTGDGGAPLVRYHIADEGGLFGFDELVSRVEALGFDRGPAERAAPIRRLPFAFVFGRSHFTVSFFGANVFPENVAVGLEQADVREQVTGKFVLESREDEGRDRFLHLDVELAPGVAASDGLAATIAERVREHVARLNSEFAHYVPPDRQAPHVVLRPHGDPACFPIGVKHRYTRKG